MPGVGLEYRYPILANTPIGSMVFEPIGQIIARPNQLLGSDSLVNLDAQSLVFDDTTLFAWDKYSGYDRFETGTRANYGGEATLNFKNGSYVNFVAGQSYQVAGTNSYATPDAANVGLEFGTGYPRFGLCRRLHAWCRVRFSPSPPRDASTRQPSNRVALISSRNINLGAWTGSVQFADYQAQPVIGYDVTREGPELELQVPNQRQLFRARQRHFRHEQAILSGELDRLQQSRPLCGCGARRRRGYKDDCTTFTVNYSHRSMQDNGTGAFVHDQTLMVELQLRTLGDATVRQTADNNTSLDGVR